MGLKQSIKFDYVNSDEITEFIQSFSNKYSVTRNKDLFVISSNNDVKFTVDISIESYGFNTDRSGNYFEFLGRFIEMLTGKYGCIEIDDM